MLAQRDAALATLERYDALLVQLWILADQLLIKSLQNKVMVKLLAVEDREIGYATTSWLRYIYNSANADSPLYRYAVRYTATFWKDGMFKVFKDSAPEVLRDVLILLIIEGEALVLRGREFRHTFFGPWEVYMIQEDGSSLCSSKDSEDNSTEELA